MLPHVSQHRLIIVGAGSAGCVLAARLTEDSGRRVLLIEAGGTDRGLALRMPAAAPLAARDPRWDWGYLGEPEPYLNGRRILQHRGRVLGGSSAINGMVANRGNPRDYDGWAAAGLADWRYADCLPYFRRMETFAGGGDAWRGGEGPQHIERCPAAHPLDRAFLEAGRQAGYGFTDDQNGAVQDGFHVAQSFTKRGRRWSAADAFLRPALERPNLDLLTDARVRRILFDGRRAVGVETERRGVVERHEADEVILAAGAIASPQILLLSGVGGRAQLAEHAIPPVADVPAVGENLEDHLIVPIQYATPPGISLGAKLTGRVSRLRLGLQWLLTRKGLGASTLCETGCFFKSSEAADYVDLQHEFYAMTAYMGEAESNVAEGFMFSMGIMRPASRGWVRLASADPRAPPRILYNYLAAESDRRAMIEGVRRSREMAAQPAFDGLRLEEIAPGPEVTGDAEILAWIAAAGSSEYHPCSTCRMGTGEDSVVDTEGRVHETEALRVADASILPHNVTANLNAPVLMVAEKLADAIAGKTPLPAEAPRAS